MTLPTGDERQFDFARAASLLTDAAAKAGAAIMVHYGKDEAVELKGDASPVTAADRDAEAIILRGAESLAPDIPVVSEETAGDRHAALDQRFFLVDPLDGTKEFIKKRTDFTVNIALIERADRDSGWSMRRHARCRRDHQRRRKQSKPSSPQT